MLYNCFSQLTFIHYKIVCIIPLLIYTQYFTHGLLQYIRRIDMLNQNHKGLKPVMTQSTTPRLSVSELLDRHTPILRPIHDTSPLPPIMAIPHPPEKPRVAT